MSNIKNNYDDLIDNIVDIKIDDCYIPIDKYNNKKNILVLSGGGIKGLAHLGALHFLEEENILNDIQIFAGTSVGALLSTLIIIGYRPAQIFDILLNENLNNLKCIDIFDIFDTFGIDSGKNIQFFINRLIEKRDLPSDISLNNLYKITQKKIIFTTVCVNTKNVVYISYLSHPDLALNKAIMMSISIPWFYKPIQFNDDLYIDGGCIDNYPIHIFADKLDQVIGIYLTQSKYILNNIPNIETYTCQILQCFMESMDYNSMRGFENYTIKITLDNLSAIDYEIPKKDKIKMFESGYNTMKNNFYSIH